MDGCGSILGNLLEYFEPNEPFEFTLASPATAPRALQGLCVLGARPAGTVMVLRDIAAARTLPVGLLARTFQRLVRHGVVVSHRGTVRGYALAAPPAQISLREIFDAVEGPHVFARCTFSVLRCPRSNPCRLHPVWSGLRSQLEHVMARTSLSDIIASRAGTRSSLPGG
jgi:Rrf2 family transcriptional regulator, iron-sulfur cluster assembly transcription factor